MKSRIILPIIVAVALTSCSVYKAGQTPDDVYYSPARSVPAATYAETDNQRDGRYSPTPNNSYNDAYYSDPYATDYWLRMRAHNPYRWGAFDDYSYGYGGYGYGNDWRFNAYNNNWYSPLNVGIGIGYGNYWNNYHYWNSYYNPYYSSYSYYNPYYNPYYGNVIILNPKVNSYIDNTMRNNVRPFNVGSYSNRNYNNSNLRLNNGNPGSYEPAHGNYNNSNTLGNSLRRVFNGNSNNGSYNNSPSDRPARIYTPSPSPSYTPSSGGGGSSGGSSGGSGVTRPGRG